MYAWLGTIICNNKIAKWFNELIVTELFALIQVICTKSCQNKMNDIDDIIQVLFNYKTMLMLQTFEVAGISKYKCIYLVVIIFYAKVCIIKS